MQQHLETAAAPLEAAGRRRLLWRAGARGSTQPAAPRLPALQGPWPLPAASLVPALLPTLPVSGRSTSRQTAGARCLSSGRAIASPAPSACAWVRVRARAKRSWRRRLPRETSPSRSGGLFASQLSSAAASTAQDFTRLRRNTAVYGKDERRELWSACGNQGLLSSSCSQSASLHGR